MNQSLSLILGIILLGSGFAQEALAYPIRVRTNPYPGIHRTIISPNTPPRRSYYQSHPRYHQRSHIRSREIIIIERDRGGYCRYGNCTYPSYSYPSNNDRGSQRYYNRNRWK